MATKIFSREIDPATPHKLTAKQKAELNALVAKTDAEIDVSDQPPLNEAFWNNATRRQAMLKDISKS